MGEEIWQPKAIAIHYLKTDFVIDVLSTVPFDQVVKGLTRINDPNAKPNTLLMTIASLIKLLKMIRIKRIGIAIRNMNQEVELKTYLKIA